VTRELKKPVSTILDDPPKNVMGNLNGDMGPEARKQCFTVLAETFVQRLSPKNKGFSPYLPLQTDYRGNRIKKQGLTHIWLYANLLATSP
jgi:hypothetical protein